MLEIFPTLNASLNATAAVLLTAGWLFIRRGQVEWHRRAMLAAFGVSVVFLGCYLAYHVSIEGPRRFPGEGSARALYLAILGTHTVLAATVPFLAALTLWRGLKGRYVLHKAVARWTLPIWLYVSVTGVAVYWMLYRMTWN